MAWLSEIAIAIIYPEAHSKPNNLDLHQSLSDVLLAFPGFSLPSRNTQTYLIRKRNILS
ncbi:MAG: hypothetical protein HWQ38_38570 [Nostoc sp. NMS7]|uniref:hypothetical protein n=1 Tax=Nostoc sp. NMS7 TaxID=2815391 RepID=UPI0025EC4B8D|nr:hypothetical protein [Nostoc sp. NMS7]MBN3952062.1 hypothetical protein [Nostoc sp. NMS7]